MLKSVRPKPIGHSFDQGRTFSRARFSHCLLGRCDDSKEVIAIHLNSIHSIGDCFLSDRLRGGLYFSWNGNSELIIWQKKIVGVLKTPAKFIAS
jgi:hypothetical protein